MASTRSRTRVIITRCGRCTEAFSYERQLKQTGRQRSICDPCIPLRAVEHQRERPYRPRDPAQMRASRLRHQEMAHA